jgi:hypothetical protein
VGYRFSSTCKLQSYKLELVDHNQHTSVAMRNNGEVPNALTKLSESVESIIRFTPKDKSLKANGDIGEFVEQEMLGAARPLKRQRSASSNSWRAATATLPRPKHDSGGVFCSFFLAPSSSTPSQSQTQGGGFHPAPTRQRSDATTTHLRCLKYNVFRPAQTSESDAMTRRRHGNCDTPLPRRKCETERVNALTRHDNAATPLPRRPTPLVPPIRCAHPSLQTRVCSRHAPHKVIYCQLLHVVVVLLYFNTCFNINIFKNDQENCRGTRVSYPS